MKQKKTEIIFRLDEILKEQGRGVREIARATGISTSTIGHILHNHSKAMYLDVLARLCEELNIEPHEIYKVTKK